MISWKHSFDKINEEFEIVKKKKQALDSLLDNGRISQSTYDLFNKEIEDAIADIERQQTALLERMNSKIEELKQQIKTLEILLANFEIQHVMGEIEEEKYQREVNLLSTGLENAKQELAAIQETVNQLSTGAETEAVQPEPSQSSEEVAVQPEIDVPAEETPALESEEAPEEVVQEASQESSVEVGEVEPIQNQQEQEQLQEVTSETPQDLEEQQQMEEAESEEEENEE